MKPFFWLRMMALVKRGVIALELLAASQRAIAETVTKRARRKKTPRVSEVFTPSVDERNRDWQRRRDAELYGEELPE